MKPLTPADIVPMVYDPARTQQLVLNNITNYQINDPTNPFIMLVEAASVMAAASATESESALKRMYPSLATSVDEIFQHITDNELVNVFSSPSETSIVFYISIRDLRSNGNRVDSLGYVETIIPMDTVVSITSIPFTLLNDVHVKLYDSGVVFAEQITSTDIAANNSLGILSSGIVNFQDGEPWIAVETTVKQINKNTIIKTITASEGFKLSVNHSDQYYYSDVYFRSANTNNVWVKTAVTHTSTFINPEIPTMSIKLLDKVIVYTIPDVYLLSGQISGEVKIVLYETKGYLNLPIYKYQMSEYVINLNTVTTDAVKATIANITVYANSRAIVNGGTTGFTFQELKSSIIHNTLGYTNLPVTTAQLVKDANVSGFDLHGVLDIVTDRVFVAARNMDRYASELVRARPDVFFNTVSLDLGVIANTKIIVDPGYALIPSGTMFKETNGIINVLSDTEVTALQAMTNNILIDYLKTNRVFFTPYYYIMDITDTSAIDTRVYDLDSPSLADIKITGKNTNIIERVNVGKYGLVKTSTGYDLIISVLSNTEFGNTNTALLKGQLSISMFAGQSDIHFDGVYDPATELMTFRIDTNFNLTVDDLLEVTNGVSGVSNTFIDLLTTGTIYLYSTDAAILDTANYLVSDIKIPGTNITVFDREEVKIEFGRPVTYIWNKMFSTYTDRQYQIHTVDKPLVYPQDVYTIDPVTGSIITIVNDINGVPTATRTLLHTQGAPVLDNAGNPTYEYRIGDIVLDANGVPAIDLISGVIRHIDVLMLEYEFLAATGTISSNYLTAIKDTLNGWLFTNLTTLNADILENTSVLYKSYKKSAPVEIVVESVHAKVPYMIRPTVVLYSSRTDYTTAEMNNLTTEIGYLIHSYLDNQDVNITTLKKSIIDNVDSSIISAKIDGIETYSNSEIFSTVDPMTRLSLGKKLVNNNNNELEVTYDITLKIHKV